MRRIMDSILVELGQLRAAIGHAHLTVVAIAAASTLTAWKSSISIGECDERFGGQMSNKSLSEDD
jgi:hypothetical protein